MIRRGVTPEEVEEFHRLGKEPRGGYPGGDQRYRELWDRAYQTEWLTPRQLENEIMRRPFNRSAVDACVPRIARVIQPNPTSFVVWDTSRYPERVFVVGLNTNSKDGIGMELVHEMCHIYYGVFGPLNPGEKVIERCAVAALKGDPGIGEYALKKLEESGKLTREQSRQPEPAAQGAQLAQKE